MKKKATGRPFEPGQCGNLNGRPKKDPLIHAFKETSYKDFILHLQKYGCYTPDEIEKEVKRPDVTMFELIFTNIILGASRGEKDARAVLLDRLWGKVKEVHELHNYDKELAEIPKERIIEFLKEKDD